MFLGFLTALPGLMASVTAAAKGLPDLAVSNAMGGIAVQTTALAIADIAHREANLEHAAASVPNMMQATILIALMVLVLCGFSAPDVTVGHIHPVTLLLLATAAGGFYLVLGTRDAPMWLPTHTDETVVDEPLQANRRRSLGWMLAGLVFTAGLTGLSGALVAEAAENIVDKTGMSPALGGGLLTALATALPALLTTAAAVGPSALTLAVSDIVGGNLFDVLFVAAADIAYWQGSIYHAESVGMREVFLTSFTVLLNVILLAGLIFRQKQGPGNIGFESVLMLLLSMGGFLVLALIL